MNLNLWLNIIGGLVVLGSYATVLPRQSSTYWWMGMPERLRRVVWVTLTVAVASYVAAFAIGYARPYPWAYYIMMLAFYVGAAMWAPMVHLQVPSMVLLALTLTSVGALGMAVFSYDPAVFILMFLVFMHCLIMDNVIWYMAYLDTIVPSTYA